MNQSSVDFNVAASRKWDAIVIGAGPGGSVVAHQLATAGFSTLVVDRKSFPRDKVCGACVNGRALKALRQIGMGDAVAGLPSTPASKLQLRYGSQQAEIRLPDGLITPRSKFDTALLEAATNRGACFLPATTAIVLPSEPLTTRAVELSDGNLQTIVHSRVVLVADGLNNSSLKQLPEFQPTIRPGARIGVGGTLQTEDGTDLTPGTIFMAADPRGYVGMVQFEGNRLNIAAAINADFIKECGTPAKAIASILKKSRFGSPSEGSIEDTKWHGTAQLTRSNSDIAGHRMLLIGDATGYIEPFTGEGMAWAITGGIAAAEIAGNQMTSGDWSSNGEDTWRKKHRKIIGNRQLACRVISWLLRYPLATHVTVQAMKHSHWLALPIVHSINDLPNATANTTKAPK